MQKAMIIIASKYCVSVILLITRFHLQLTEYTLHDTFEFNNRHDGKA
jgi:hypothetical protein